MAVQLIVGLIAIIESIKSIFVTIIAWTVLVYRPSLNTTNMCKPLFPHQKLM